MERWIVYCVLKSAPFPYIMTKKASDGEQRVEEEKWVEG